MILYYFILQAVNIKFRLWLMKIQINDITIDLIFIDSTTDLHCLILEDPFKGEIN